jgi:hypothetical protein
MTTTENAPTTAPEEATMAKQRPKTSKTNTKPKPRKPRAATGKAAGSGPAQPLSVKDAAEKVLRDAKGPLHATEIAKQILDQKLITTKGKTPAASIGARLATGAKPGGPFVRTADAATFDLRELNPRGARKRPEAKPLTDVEKKKIAQEAAAAVRRLAK